MSSIQVSRSRCYALWVVVARKVVSQTNNFLKCISIATNGFYLDVVSNELFLSLPYMDNNWNWGTVKWRLAYDTQMTWTLARCMLLIVRGRGICYLPFFFIVNCIDGRIDFTWSSKIWTSSWWGQRMNVSSTYLSHVDVFTDVDPYAITSKYSLYMLANTGDNIRSHPEVGCLHTESQHLY